uniref:Transmembrane protein n=1 Tax=Tetranychus urticae TaxID=32264 RepID=T1KZB2_TETUR
MSILQIFACNFLFFLFFVRLPFILNIFDSSFFPIHPTLSFTFFLSILHLYLFPSTDKHIMKVTNFNNKHSTQLIQINQFDCQFWSLDFSMIITTECCFFHQKMLFKVKQQTKPWATDFI